MTEPWFIFVESNTSGTGRLFARTARDLGCRPVMLTSSPQLYPYLSEEAIDIRVVSGDDPSALLSAARELSAMSAIGGVVSSSEHFIAAAAGLARKLQLPGPDPGAIKICRNKAAQRLALARAGDVSPRFALVTAMSELQSAIGPIGYPAVVKPVCGTGSSGVRLCASPRELKECVQRQLAVTVNERGMSIPAGVLVEEYLDGPEFSVEMFDGRVIGITRKHLSPAPVFVEIGHDYPAPLNRDLAARIEQCARKVVALLSVDWGPVHVELRLVNRTPKIVEVNPRLAGGFIPMLVQISTGIDLIRSTLIRSLSPNTYATLSTSPSALQRSRQEGAAIRFILATHAGVLAAIPGVDEARASPGIRQVHIYRSIRDRLLIHGDFRDRIGHVISAASTAATAARFASFAAGLLRPVITREASNYDLREPPANPRNAALDCTDLPASAASAAFT